MDMTHGEWIESLRTAFRTEGAAAVFVRNTVSTLAWSGLTDDRRAETAQRLGALADGAARRAARLGRLLALREGKERGDVL